MTVKETLVEAYRAVGWGFVEACENADMTMREAADHIARTGKPYRFAIRLAHGKAGQVFEISGRG